MVIKGQRLPSFQMTQAIARALKMNRNEQRYFELQVSFAKATRKSLPTDAIAAEMAQLSPTFRRRTTVTPAAFSYISAWYHIVLKQLVGTPGFQEDPSWIHRRLRRKVSLAEIRGSLQTLLDLNMIRRRDDGKLEVTEANVQTQPDVPSAAVRSHLKGMLDRAGEALEEQAVRQREMATATCRIDPRAIPEVKQRIRAFLDGLEDEFSSNSADSVFQINVQFFEHTTSATTTAP